MSGFEEHAIGYEALRSKPTEAKRERPNNGSTYDPGWLPEPAQEEPVLPLKLTRASDYAGVPVPVTDFLDIHQLFPIGHSAIFSGDGGVGKTMMLMQLMVAYVTSGIWMGSQIFNGNNPSCLFYSAEEPEDVVHPRLDTIARRMNNTPLSDLPMLQIYYGEDDDTVLFEGDRYGKTKTTHAFKRLCLTIEQTRPGLIVIDNRSQIAAGDENNRTFATGVITALERLAQKYKCVVVLLAHPSLTGMNSGTGTSGSTAWRGKARSFIYVEIPGAEADDDGPPVRDSGKRHMTLAKSNYGPQGSVLKLKWSDGIFDIERHEQTNIDQQLVRVKEVFLTLLDIFEEKHANLSTNPTATKNYAPKAFSAHPAGKKYTYKQFERAMDALLEEKQIVNVKYGSGTNKRWRLQRNVQ